MRLTINEETGEKTWSWNFVLVDGIEKLEIIRTWTSAETTGDGRYAGMRIIHELPEGRGFVYANGKEVEHRKDLDIIDEAHRNRAYAWFDNKMKQAEEPVSEPADETPKKRGRPPKKQDDAEKQALEQRIDELELKLKMLQEGGYIPPTEGTSS